MIDWEAVKAQTPATSAPPPPPAPAPSGFVDWEAIRRTVPARQVGPAQMPTAPSGLVNWEAIRQTTPTRQAGPAQTYLSGGPVSDIFDILRTGEFAVGGLLSGKGIRRGIRERTETYPILLRNFVGAGNTPNFADRAAAFTASLILDPINLVGVGLPGKALRAVGLPRAAEAVDLLGTRLTAPVARAAGAVAERVAPNVVRAARGRRLLEPIIERQVIEESAGIERSMDLAKAIRLDAAKVTGNARDARRLDQALGGYFDAGADAMMNAIAAVRTQAAAAVSPEVLAAARQAGLRAQEAFLQSLPEEAQAFVREWAPVAAKQDREFAEQLVRVGMMKPETAAKWEGLHLRRIYQKFEDPKAYVEFLERADPVEAARLLGQMERGVPIRRVGQPIPTAVTEARKLIPVARRAELGVIERASSRVAAGGILASRAIARGDAYAKVASQFAVDEALVRSLPDAARYFRQMPDTPGWGQLAGRWLPKEIADPLLQMERRPEGLDALLQRLTGWFKYAKVIANPATHFRNIRTNISLAHNAAGLGALDPHTWKRAVQEVLTNGPAFREAKSVSSAFIDTFTGTELKNFIADASENGLVSFFRRAGAALARAYQAEEQIGKMAVYLTARGRGLSSEAAAKLAEVALFNYRKVPAVVDRLRRIGVYPFLTFPYKVATQTLPLAIRRPGRFALQAKVIQGIGEPLTEEEQRALPAWMRGGGWLKLPWRVNGHPVLYDLTYELPWGDIAESGTPAAAVLQLVRAIRAGEPLEDALRSLTPFLTPAGQVAAEIILNRSAFQGRPVYTPVAPPGQQAGEIAQHLVRFAAPGIIAKTVLPGGELRRAIEGTLPGGRSGVTPGGAPPLPLGQAVASTVFGLKTRPLDIERERLMARLDLRRKLDDIRHEMVRVTRNQALSPPEREQRLRILRERAQTLQRRFVQTGTAELP
jgi:hypothetical protein